MIGYAANRFLSLLAALLAASIVVFALLDLLPGDPASFMMGLDANRDALAALRAELGLDHPAWQRYLAWMWGMAHGDFGVSYTYRVPVAGLIAERAAVSVPLAAIALLLSTGLGIGLALLSFILRGKFVRAAIEGFSQLGIAAPNFWVAILLVQIFAVGLGWFSAGGFPGWDAGLAPALRALALPALALALPQAAILMRVTRAAMLEAARQPYVETARAKGLSRARIVAAHLLPNALTSVLTLLGLQFTFLLAGAVIVENVFSLPGLGRLVLQAVAQRDLIVVRGVVMVMVFAAVAVAFLVDLLYVWADPRVRSGRTP
ncbi:MAG: ABC transporter permease [Pseudomonadota bacterium]